MPDRASRAGEAIAGDILKAFEVCARVRDWEASRNAGAVRGRGRAGDKLGGPAATLRAGRSRITRRDEGRIE